MIKITGTCCFSKSILITFIKTSTKFTVTTNIFGTIISHKFSPLSYAIYTSNYWSFYQLCACLNLKNQVSFLTYFNFFATMSQSQDHGFLCFTVKLQSWLLAPNQLIMLIDLLIYFMI